MVYLIFSYFYSNELICFFFCLDNNWFLSFIVDFLHYFNYSINHFSFLSFKEPFCRIVFYSNSNEDLCIDFKNVEPVLKVNVLIVLDFHLQMILIFFKMYSLNIPSYSDINQNGFDNLLVLRLNFVVYLVILQNKRILDVHIPFVLNDFQIVFEINRVFYYTRHNYTHSYTSV